MSVLYRSDFVRGPGWAEVFARLAPDLDFRLWPDTGDLNQVEYLVAWRSPPGFFAQLPRLKVLFSSGAGIDHIDLKAVPEHVTIVRMVEPGLINGIVEYVTMSVLALHRNLFDYMRMQKEREWRVIEVLPASDRTVGVMGLGVLGKAVLDRLSQYGYVLRGWSRRLEQLPGVTCYAGAESLEPFLAECDYLVCTLPLTPATRGILNERVFSALPAGAALISVGRGAQLDEQALLAALSSGRISMAILDVFETEPLPKSHPFWGHPGVLVTPHIAGQTQAVTAAPIVIENIRKHQRGEPMQDVIDRSRGY
jgi:glyoxylate/hydroxypyruvate reductase A